MTDIQAATDGGGFVRNLGPFEELYWLYNQLGAHGFVYAMEVEGPRTVPDWCRALAAVQQSQPFFSVRIESYQQGAPFFRHVDVPIPLRVIDGASSPRWEYEMAREVHTPFDGATAPLLRAVLIRGPKRAAFMLAAHHSISDGISMTAALGDLFRALTGDTIERHPVLPSLEESLGVPRGPFYKAPDAPSTAAPHGIYRSVDRHPPRIETLRCDVAVTKQLVSRARSEDATVHGALCSAVVQAGRKLSPAWRQKTVRVLSPINLRKDTAVGNSSALYCLGGITPVEADNLDGFWGVARQFTRTLPAQRSAPALQSVAKAMTQAVVQGLDVEGAKRFLPPFDVIISNVGQLNIGGFSGELNLRSIWGMSSLTGALDEQIIGAATLNGCLHLTYTSHTPLHSLLMEVEQLLRNACC